MSNLVRDPRGCKIITEANAGEPLIALVKGPPSWLREQVATILKHMNIPVADIIAQNANSAVEAYLDKQRKGKKTKREQSPRKHAQNGSHGGGKNAISVKSSTSETGGTTTKRAKKPPTPRGLVKDGHVGKSTRRVLAVAAAPAGA